MGSKPACPSFNQATGGSKCNGTGSCCTSSTISYSDGGTCSSQYKCQQGTYNRVAYSTLGSKPACPSFNQSTGGSACYGSTCCTGSASISGWKEYFPVIKMGPNYGYQSSVTYSLSCHSGGTPSCTSSNTAVAKCSVKNTSITITSGGSTGTATITLTCSAAGDYCATSASYTIRKLAKAFYCSCVCTSGTKYIVDSHLPASSNTCYHDGCVSMCKGQTNTTCMPNGQYGSAICGSAGAFKNSATGVIITP